MAMARAEAMGRAVEQSAGLLTRFLEGFDESNRTRQAPALPNHACWRLGHCALTMLRVRDKLTGEGLPERDFIVGSAAGDEARFGTETIAFGSQPTDEPGIYPTPTRAREIFEQAAAALGAAARSAPESRLDEPLMWGAARVPTTPGDLLGRIVFHNGTHAGQLVDLRRVLQMVPVIR